MDKPDLRLEKLALKKGYQLVIGVDEVGRGALAGPVVAAAVVLTGRFLKRTVLLKNSSFLGWEEIGIDDSKRLSMKKREELAKVINKHAIWGIGEVGPRMIDKLGVVKATEKAMRQAIKNLLESLKMDARDLLDLDNLKSRRRDRKIKKSRIQDPEYPSSDFKNSRVFVLVDAFHVKYIPGVGLANQGAIVKGDQKVLSIAAASIIAKVYRDKVMRKIHRNNPGYWEYRWDRNKGYGTADHLAAIKRHGTTRLHRLAFVKNII